MTKLQNHDGPSSRRDELLQVAARVFAEKGFANATVRDIGEEAGILSGSLYHHFESKDAILEDLLLGLFDEMRQGYIDVTALQLPADEAIRELLATGFGYLETLSNEIHVLNNDLAYISRLPRLAFVAERTKENERIWIDTLVRGAADGTFRPDLDVELAYRIMMGSLVAAVRWFSPGGPMSARALGERVASFYLGGLLNRPEH